MDRLDKVIEIIKKDISILYADYVSESDPKVFNKMEEKLDTLTDFLLYVNSIAVKIEQPLMTEGKELVLLGIIDHLKNELQLTDENKFLYSEIQSYNDKMEVYFDIIDKLTNLRPKNE